MKVLPKGGIYPHRIIHGSLQYKSNGFVKKGLDLMLLQCTILVDRDTFGSGIAALPSVKLFSMVILDESFKYVEMISAVWLLYIADDTSNKSNSIFRSLRRFPADAACARPTWLSCFSGSVSSNSPWRIRKRFRLKLFELERLLLWEKLRISLNMRILLIPIVIPIQAIDSRSAEETHD